MSVEEAARVLGVPAGAPADDLRRAFRRAVRRAHPDVNAAGDATERTVALSVAYRVLLGAASVGAVRPPAEHADDGATGRPGEPSVAGRSQQSAEQSAEGPPTPPPAAGATGAAGSTGLEAVHLVDAETIAVRAPGAEALLAVIDAAHRLGEISYLDPSAGLLEVVVEFVEAPISSVVLSLQGRSNATTEVFCSVEPLSGGESPPVDAVVRLLLRTLRGEDPSQ